jgi:hypothetical protein|tara:strand:- start:446 stop:838 length:393 start_codon:yes stop_codon:yes gene_type:complete
MEQEEYLKNDTNRLEYVVDDIINELTPDDRMLALLGALPEVEVVPDVGRYYTFIYTPKTPRIQYDEFPLIACIDVLEWGFKGINYHWAATGQNPFRNYTWDEVQSNLHVIYPLELNDTRSIPYQNFKINT